MTESANILHAEREIPEFAARYANLANARLGAEVIEVTDEFFAERGRLLKAEEPVFVPDLYDDHGKWMDGWETRRRRTPGFDWIIVALGEAGVLDHMIVDTAHYKGNFPASCSMNGRLLTGADMALLDNPDALKADSQFWPELLPSQRLTADSEHRFDGAQMSADAAVNVVRFNIVPDGGISRLRLFGKTTPRA